MSLFGKSGRRMRGRDRNRTTRPVIELFEARTLLAVFTVTSTGDSGNNTLRDAITLADGTPGSTIKFDIPSGPFVIDLTSGALPPISAATKIDGTSQPGYAGTPIIVINGSSLSTGSGLDLTANSSTIEGLDIVGFIGAGAAGIDVASNSNLVESNEIGVAPGGTSGPGNSEGILITGSDNQIGGTSGSTNTIGFNTAAGVSISGAGATGNLVTGNFIGTDAASDDLGNLVGVSVNGSDNNTIGQAGAANTIGFNSVYGVSILAGSGDVVSQDQYEGTNGPNPSVPDNDINVASTANGGQLPPAILSTDLSGSNLGLQAALTVPGGTTGTNVTFEVYQDVATATPALRQFAGTVTVPYSASGIYNVTVPLSVGLSLGDEILATATASNNGTSAFSAEVPIANPYVVTNNAASGPGSLYQAIQYADVNPNPSAGTTHITFAITGSTVIGFNPADPLDITVPMTIDGTSQSGVQLNGGGQASDGLILGANSTGSTIKGLDVVNFAGAAIRVESKGDTIADDRIGTDVAGTGSGPGNRVGILIDGASGGQAATIGGTSASAANTIGFNTAAGVSISGAGGDRQPRHRQLHRHRLRQRRPGQPGRRLGQRLR